MTRRAGGPLGSARAGPSALRAAASVPHTDRVTDQASQGATEMAKAYILIHTAAGAGGEVRDRIRTIPGVLAAHVLTGAYDVIVEAWGKSQHDIRSEVIEPIEA